MSPDVAPTLKLSPGDYAFTRVTIEPEAKIEIDDGSGPVRILVDDGVTFRGRVITTSGEPPALLVVQLGGSQISMLDASFRGTAIAPQANLILGPGGQPHEGAFIAKSVTAPLQSRARHQRLGGVDGGGADEPYDIYLRVHNPTCNDVAVVGVRLLSADPSAINTSWESVTSGSGYLADPSGDNIAPANSARFFGPYTWTPTAEQAGAVGIAAFWRASRWATIRSWTSSM